MPSDESPDFLDRTHRRVFGEKAKAPTPEARAAPRRAERETRIRNKYGFHVRPATRFLELAKQYKSAIEVRANGKSVDGTSAIALLSLGAVQGDSVAIVCRGEDAEAACEALLALVESRFDGIE
ncbi:MAG: HPr family phosphocarrier protein [Planctomycetota bacterium]